MVSLRGGGRFRVWGEASPLHPPVDETLREGSGMEWRVEFAANIHSSSIDCMALPFFVQDNKYHSEMICTSSGKQI